MGRGKMGGEVKEINAEGEMERKVEMEGKIEIKREGVREE